MEISSEKIEPTFEPYEITIKVEDKVENAVLKAIAFKNVTIPEECASKVQTYAGGDLSKKHAQRRLQRFLDDLGLHVT